MTCKSIFSVLILSGFATAATILVPGDAATIQGGINLASEGDSVLVGPGIYYENVEFNGRNVALFGVEGRDSTIIDGSLGETCVVRFIDGETPVAVLDGFTLRNGMGYLNQYGIRIGGGILCRYESSPTLRNLIIEDCTALGTNAAGGAIMCSVNSNALIENVLMRNNRSYAGGGLGIYFSTPLVRNVVISDNEGTYTGGGVYIEGMPSAPGSPPEVILDQCTIRGNVGGNLGGAHGIVIMTNAKVTLNRCTITENTNLAQTREVLGIAGNCDVKLINTILWQPGLTNIATFVPAYAASDILIMYCDVSDGTNSISASQGEVGWGVGNIIDDPRFEEWTNRGYSLQAQSPCIDAGEDLVIVSGDTLISLPESCYCGEAPDIGALEWLNPTGLTNAFLLPGSMGLEPNFPNPFNPSTTIQYQLSRRGQVDLSVYDLSGRLVTTLVSGFQSAGEYTLEWNTSATTLTAGIYLARLSAGGETQIIRMTLLK